MQGYHLNNPGMTFVEKHIKGATKTQHQTENFRIQCYLTQNKKYI